MRLYVFLLVLLLALLAAVLHPFGLLLTLLPWNSNAFRSFLMEVRTFMTDLLAWAFLIFIAQMIIGIANDRLRRSRSNSGGDHVSIENAASESDPTFVVAIVAFNEQEAIGDLVSDFYEDASVRNVIVVDNNSTDDTAEIAARAGARVVREPKQGYGFACIRALREASEDQLSSAAVLVEGDGTFAAADLAKFRPYLKHADLVLGTRVVPHLVDSDSQMDRFFTWGNIVVSMMLRLRFWNGQFLGKARLSDMGCTYRVIRMHALRDLLPDLASGGDAFLAQMMLLALGKGMSVIEVPITFRRRIGESKGASRSLAAGLRAGVEMIWLILTFETRGVHPYENKFFEVHASRLNETSKARDDA